MAEPLSGRSLVAWLVAWIAAGALLTTGGVYAARALLGPDESPPALGAPLFVEETAGIDHSYDGEFTFFVGGGVAAFDCDEDGRSDLFFAGGVNPASLYRNQSPVGGELRFSEVSDPAVELTEVVGAYPLDIDSDGHTDLAVLRFGENVLLRGLGDCRFERANEAWSFDGGSQWTAGFSAKWDADAALPTMAFGNYLALDASLNTTWDCADSELLRPATQSSWTVTPLSPGWCTLSVLFTDWDRSGRRDLRMANDRHYYREGEEQLWRVAEGEPPTLYGREEGWDRLVIWGMGIAGQDVTGDGYPEFVITSQGDNKLQTLEDGAARPDYSDIAIRRGATAHRPFMGDPALPSTAWHPEFQDVNNDGYMDLFISKGNVEAMPEYAAADPNNLLLGQADGTFLEGAYDAGVVDFNRSRGAALVDFNLDGLLDLVVVDRRENVAIWRNAGDPGPMGNWVALRLEQAAPNGDAVGAWIEVRTGDRTIERELTVGGGHAGGQLGWIHFGLGDAGSAEVRIRWPDGEVGDWLSLDANSFAIIERGTSVPSVWDPATGEVLP